MDWAKPELRERLIRRGFRHIGDGVWTNGERIVNLKPRSYVEPVKNNIRDWFRDKLNRCRRLLK